MNLGVIGRLDILERLYGKVFIPEAVLNELSAMGLKQLDAREIQLVSWIETRAVSNQLMVNSLTMELDAGEAEAIALAVDMEADLLLVDERQGRKVASRLGLKHIGLMGVLVDAKNVGFIAEVKPILDDLIAKAGFWVGRQLYARILAEARE